ncbi:MAG: TIM barrel protein, partial [Desulfobacterales bacterium]
QYIDTIGYIHIADVPGRHEPGTGEINFTNVIKTLQKLKYDGNIGFELTPLQDSTAAVQRIRDL